jgi:hypothetical protein
MGFDPKSTMYESPQANVRKLPSGDPTFNPPGGVSPQQVDVAVGVNVAVAVLVSVGVDVSVGVLVAVLV